MHCVAQVVVDSEATAKALLARGQLRNRVTIIPLNKARAPTPGCSSVDAHRQISAPCMQFPAPLPSLWYQLIGDFADTFCTLHAPGPPSHLCGTS